MVIKRKTQIILALLVTCIFLFQNCASIIPGSSKKRFQERREGDIVITKKDGHKIAGELITIKPNSLLLLDTEGKDVSIDIADIRTIRILKKEKDAMGAGIGVVVGGCIGLYGIISSYNASVNRGEDGGFISYLLLGSLVVPVVAIVGGFIGGSAGAIMRTDKTIYLEEMTDSEIREVMNKLSKKARIRDYK